MLINGKGATESIILSSLEVANAEVLLAEGSEMDSLYIRWEVVPEDWYRPNDRSVKHPSPLTNSTDLPNKKDIQFSAPAVPGPYRLYVFVEDQDSHFASCNIPFYVLDQP